MKSDIDQELARQISILDNLNRCPVVKLANLNCAGTVEFDLASSSGEVHVSADITPDNLVPLCQAISDLAHHTNITSSVSVLGSFLLIDLRHDLCGKKAIFDNFHHSENGQITLSGVLEPFSGVQTVIVSNKSNNRLEFTSNTDEHFTVVEEKIFDLLESGANLEGIDALLNRTINKILARGNTALAKKIIDRLSAEQIAQQTKGCLGQIIRTAQELFDYCLDKGMRFFSPGDISLFFKLFDSTTNYLSGAHPDTKTACECEMFMRIIQQPWFNQSDFKIQGGNTLLHLSAEYGCIGSIEIIKVLIDTGVDLNIVNNVGQTAMHVAAINNNFSVLTLLLDQPSICLNQEILNSLLALDNLSPEIENFIQQRHNDLVRQKDCKKTCQDSLVQQFSYYHCSLRMLARSQLTTLEGSILDYTHKPAGAVMRGYKPITAKSTPG